MKIATTVIMYNKSDGKRIAERQLSTLAAGATKEAIAEISGHVLDMLGHDGTIGVSVMTTVVSSL